jgi:beta-fructofuranosidase
MLQLADRWVWDFWFAKDGNDYHIFYLQADKALKREFFRHWNVSVGHAVSSDLINWTILPDALYPTSVAAGKSAWDDYTTWTGSIIQHEQVWYMLYTGSTRAEHGLIQRVGLATSTDLIQWEKSADNPIITADATWYEQLDTELWHDQAWRDPYLFQHPETGEFHVYITGRVNHGEADGRGVIAHATSNDLCQWTVRPPVTEPGDFGQMEVPQVVKMGRYYYLLFSTHRDHHSAAHLKRTNLPPVTGTHYLVSDQPDGPFSYLTDEFMVGDEWGTWYSGKLVHGFDQQWYYLAFRNFVGEDEFVGEISNPMPVTVTPTGQLIVQKE